MSLVLQQIECYKRQIIDQKMEEQNSGNRWYQILVMVLEIINMVLTVFFLIAFLHRFMKLRKEANTNNHINKYPKIRTFLSILYIILSITLFLTYSIMESYSVYELFFEGGVGQCINSLILIVHLSVLRQQLIKQKTYTPLHLFYMIYLTLISISRLILSTFQVLGESKQKTVQQVLLSLSIAITLVSICMFFTWLKKKKQLPIFIDHSQITSQGLANLSNMLSSGHVSLTRAHAFEKKIHPTVMVEKGKIRIILESYANSNNILKSNLIDSSNKTKQHSLSYNSKDKKNRHLEIISNHLYTIEDIRQIYLECNRFDILANLDLKNNKMGKLYQELQKYLQELFTIKKCYVPQILELFYIERQDVREICLKMKKQCQNTKELQICEETDQSAMFVSINIFKHLWIEDHFIFYLYIKATDSYATSTIYKRYKDFEDFHYQLKKILDENQLDYFKLPQLPKKHLFGWNITELVLERQKYLENYCRQIANDYYLMNDFPAARDFILSFLGLNKVFAIQPSIKKHQQFYHKLSVCKGNILEPLIKQEHVTFYQFKIYKNSEYSHKILRRYSEFVKLHETLENWMNNIKTTYKFLVLPDKILLKSQNYRHEKLLKYLTAILNINEIYKVYAVTHFLNLAHQHDSQADSLGLSIIKKTSQQNEFKTEEMNSSRMSETLRNSSQMHGSRLSQLIEELIID